MALPLEDRVGLDADRRARIAEAIADHHTLEDVVRRCSITLVVAQDEYTHDVVVHWENELHLVYDAT